MNKKEIKEILTKGDENIIEQIFCTREEDLAVINKQDKEFIKKEKINIEEKYEEFKIALNNMPKSFRETKEKILTSFEIYNEAIIYRNSYFNEKYYKNGLKDGIKLIIEAFK